MLTSTCISGGSVTLTQPSWSPLLVDSGPGGANNAIQAQPLYVSQISKTPALNNCPNPCNMLVAVTLNDSVYAWNADTGATIWSDCQETGCTGQAPWTGDCGTTAGAGISTAGYGTSGLPFAGIASTPVIDTVASPPAMYLTSLCETSTARGNQQWWIHRLNLYTGVDQVTPQMISGSAAGSDDADGSTIAFNAWEVSSGALLSSIQNWGNTVMDFTLSSSGGASQTPSEYFTPYGGSSVPLQAPLLGNESGGNPVPQTFQGLGQNDFDMGVSGILLFEDLDSNHRLVTVDKAGYGYLLTQGNLCGSGSGCYPGASGGAAGGATNDPGNVFSFAANQTQCPDQIGNVTGQDQSCHRVTSMAFYAGASSPSLCLWPSYEPLACFQLSNNSQQTGTGTITATGGATVTGSGTSFLSQVIPGDALIAGGCTPPSCPIITAVNSNTQLTISQNLSVSGVGWNYSGYFINPTYDTQPPEGYVQYPGGALTLTSNSGSEGVIWGLANVGGTAPGVGTLYAYDVGTVQRIWCSNANCTSNSSKFTNATFALPTIVNGYAYIPTAGISGVASGSHATCSSTAQCSGVLVYSGH
jgi:hypothetical protein